MNTLNRRAIGLAVCLSAMAGCVDVIGFLQLGGTFVSFMSGNSTQMAVAVMAHEIPRIVQLGGILALFVIGTMAGTLAGHFAPPKLRLTLVLGLVTVLLTAAAAASAVGWPLAAMGLLTVAMGAENASFQRDGDIVIGLTYMTGTLVKIGQRLALAMVGGPSFAWVPYLVLWLGLIGGGIIGAFLYHAIGLHSLWLVAAWALAMTVFARLARSDLPS